MTCPECDGDGVITWTVDRWSYGREHYTEEHGKECSHCKGSGEMREETEEITDEEKDLLAWYARADGFIVDEVRMDVHMPEIIDAYHPLTEKQRYRAKVWRDRAKVWRDRGGER
jgi:hypothetical protein